MGWLFYDYLMAISVSSMLIGLVILRVEWNYYTKHREELTRLLYGHDPFESEKKLYWSDQLIMSGGIAFGLAVAWRDKNNKKLPKEGLRVFAPHIMENENYNALSKQHPYLKKTLLLNLIFLATFLSTGGIAYFIRP